MTTVAAEAKSTAETGILARSGAPHRDDDEARLDGVPQSGDR